MSGPVRQGATHFFQLCLVNVLNACGHARAWVGGWEPMSACRACVLDCAAALRCVCATGTMSLDRRREGTGTAGQERERRRGLSRAVPHPPPSRPAAGQQWQQHQGVGRYPSTTLPVRLPPLPLLQMLFDSPGNPHTHGHTCVLPRPPTRHTAAYKRAHIHAWRSADSLPPPLHSYSCCCVPSW